MLSIVGLHEPVIPSVDVTGSGDRGSPAQIDGTGLKVGVDLIVDCNGY